MGTKDIMQAVCPVCGSAGAHFVSAYRGHHAIFSECTIVGCDNCKMGFVYPMPDEKALDDYNNAYFSNAHGGISTDSVTVAFHSAINLLRVMYVESFQQQNNIQVKNVLEIGPGGGHFARHWLTRNATANYTGVESDTSCHANLFDLGIAVYKNSKEITAGNLFDLVVISHVLEHTSDPAGFIKDCTSFLSPGGILFIEVPCKDHEHKPSVEPHLLFFDKGPMELFLTKQGFSSIKLSYHGNKIADLKRPVSFFKKIYSKGRNFLLRRHIVFPFSMTEPGLEGIQDPLERAAVKPFKAHVEQSEPSWWLRAIAKKN